MLRSTIRRRSAVALVLVSSLLAAPTLAASQDADPTAPARVLKTAPSEVILDVGETVQLEAGVVDGAGAKVEAELMFFSRSRKRVSVTRDGLVTAIKPGTVEIVVRERRRRAGENQDSRAGLGERLSGTVRVTVRPPELDHVVIGPPSGALSAGTTAGFGVSAIDVNGDPREDPQAVWSSSEPTVASFEAFGDLIVHTPGIFTAVVEVDG